MENDSFIPTPILNIFYCFNITDLESLYKIDTVNIDLKIKHKFVSFLFIILNINSPFKKIIKNIKTTLKLKIERDFNKQKNQLKEIANNLSIPYCFWLPCNYHTKDLWTIASLSNECIKKDDSLLYKYINNYHLDKYNLRMITFFDVKK